jgi:hypothetical protein
VHLPVQREVEESVDKSGVARPGEVLTPILEEAATSAQAEAESADLTQTSRPAEHTGTRIGGLFYLINLLELYDPWPSDAGVAFPSRWMLLAGLTRALLSGAGGVPMDDPVWRLLADQSDSRSVTPLGAEWELAGSLQFPSVIPFATPETLPVRFPENLVTAGLASDFARWLARLVPFYEWRLAQWLRCDVERVAEVLLYVPARVYATPTHLDVMFGLEAISLPVRRAGLDRDPRWLPAWGRVIQFHFQG